MPRRANGQSNIFSDYTSHRSTKVAQIRHRLVSIITGTGEQILELKLTETEYSNENVVIFAKYI